MHSRIRTKNRSENVTKLECKMGKIKYVHVFTYVGYFVCICMDGWMDGSGERDQHTHIYICNRDGESADAHV